MPELTEQPTTSATPAGQPTSTNVTAQPAANLTPQTPPEGATPPASYEEWIKGQDETIKGLITQRFQALETTVKATRSERDDLAKQVKEIAKKAEEGSELRKTLDSLSKQLDVAELRASFFEDAVKPEIGCANPRLAFIAAQQDQLIDGRGKVHWDELKQAYPELFKRPTPPVTNAGAGTSAPPSPAKTMNDLIRQAAGRQL